MSREYELNVRRLLCPLPVIRTQDKIKELEQGDTLRVICTDPGALIDVPTWCRINGHEVIETRQSKSDLEILIRVGIKSHQNNA